MAFHPCLFICLSKLLLNVAIIPVFTFTPRQHDSGTYHYLQKQKQVLQISFQLYPSILKSLPFRIWYFHPRKMILTVYPIYASHTLYTSQIALQPLMLQRKQSKLSNL